MNPSRAVSSLLPDWATDVEAMSRVPIITLDQAIKRFGSPTFCKIDVEGFELEVLKGLTCPIPCVSLEYHLTERDIHKTLACVAYLSRMGRLSINITLGEEPSFAWPWAVDHDEFRRIFPEKAPRSPTCGYGDIVIQMAH